MSMENKKVILKNIILNSEHCYDMTIYRLLNKDCLDDIINKIDNIPVVSNVDITKVITADEQFIQLLDRLLFCFKDVFFISGSTQYIIETIICTNKSRIKRYLLSKHYLGDNNYIDFFNDSICRIFISNFIQNSKYISLISSLLKKEKIKAKDTDEYTLDEVFKIVTLLSDLVFCSHGRYCVVYLFYNIDYEINNHTEAVNNNRKCKRIKRHYKETLIEHYKDQYELIIKDYIQRKKYLKYFR